MKIIVFDLSRSLYNIAFPTHRIKTRDELMEISIRTCRELNCSNPLPNNNISVNTVALIVRKMTRLFFFSDNKYISISIPITFQHQENNSPNFLYNSIYIDSEIWSWLIRMCVTPLDDLYDQEDFVEFECHCEERGIDIKQIFAAFKNADYGYLRYDVDPDGAKKAKEDGRPHLHPQYHCDIHLSNNATFKTGYIHSISPLDFINFIDNGSDRWYVIPATKLPKMKQ